jgi:inosine-uridine nucleoside N-ribohydrolase
VSLRLWIDTDLGDDPDDAIALLSACAHPAIDVVGISTVGGDVVARAEAARALLDAAGARVPLLYAGAPDPRALEVAEAVLAIGPLTNLAALQRTGVELPPTAVMGGVLTPTRHRGEMRDVDTNFGSDPLAAALVVAHAPDLLLVPLDVSATMIVGPTHTAQLAAVAPLTTAIGEWVGPDRPLCLHDPLALLALVGEAVRIERRTVAVTVEGRLVVDAEGVEHDVVTDADADAVITRVVGLVRSLG